MKTLAWTGVVLLALVGVLIGVTRATVVTRTLQGAPAAELSPEDRAMLARMASTLAIPVDSEQFRLMERDTRDAALRYNLQPIVVLLHVVPGAAFLLLAPLQLIGRVRDRTPAVHRSSGYLLIALAVPFVLTGFYLAVFDPFFGPWGSAAVVIATALFVNAGVQAYAAIRRGDITRHRAWMLRFLAVAYGIAVMRVISFPVIALFPISPRVLGPPTFWAGWFISIMLAEWWIRRTHWTGARQELRRDGRAA